MQLFLGEIKLKRPKISIIIPSLNQGCYLDACLDSIVMQQCPDVEIIIVDGGSTDTTHAVVEKYIEHVTVFISEPDRGQSDALNKGLALVTGDIIGWQNADDLYLPGAFDAIWGVFQSQPDVDVVFGNRLDIDANGDVVGETRFTRFSPYILRYDGICFGTQALFWRLSAAKKIGLFDLELHLSMDLEYFLRATSLGMKFHFLHKHLGAMRRHAASKTENNLGKPVHDAEIQAVYSRYYVAHPLFDKFNKIAALLLRWFYYFMQGDFDYVFRGITRRLRRGTLISGR